LTLIFGDGYATDVFSSCVCVPNYSVNSLVYAGVDLVTATRLSQQVQAAGVNNTMSNAIVYNGTEELIIFTILGNTAVCGGIPRAYPSVPMCTTVLSNHTHAVVQKGFASDGNPSTMIPESISIVSWGAAANMTWLYNSLIFLFGDNVSTIDTCELSWNGQSIAQLGDCVIASGQLRAD
jgi:hypothetical protein